MLLRTLQHALLFYELFATCRAQSKDPRVIIDKMGGGRMNQYTRYLSDRVNVAMSYD